MADYSSLDILQRSASTEQPPTVRSKTEVAKLIDVTRCIGCKACQSACEEWNDIRDDIGENIGVYDNPQDLSDKTWTLMRFTEYENTGGELEWLIRKDGCMHCGDPGCLKACPSPGAIVQYANGIVDFVEENCIGCGYCVKGCPFNIPRISQHDRKAYKCTLCSDRVSVGQAPACAKACPTGAIMFGTKEAMIEHAAERVVDLKGRGFDNAGLYNPAGVGGTHVMYVLHHADKPEIYANLPKNPKISALVQFWKGGFKIFGLATLALATVGGFFHYITAGPDEVPQIEEEEAAAEIDGHPRMSTGAETEVIVTRYTGVQRVNHWITAGLFTMLGLSGLAMFSPYLFFLTGLFGGGASTRAVHPWLGVALIVSFGMLFLRFWRLNLPDLDDVKWMLRIGDIVRNRHDRLPALGKYNAGQKGVFWSQTALILVMFTSGLVIWDQYFFAYTAIESKRWAVLAHSLAAIFAIAIILVHVYAGMWIRGTGRAMTRGSVTGGWALRHHKKWFRQAAGRGEVRRDTIGHG